jgi:hypothetical protein
MRSIDDVPELAVLDDLDGVAFDHAAERRPASVGISSATPDVAFDLEVGSRWRRIDQMTRPRMTTIVTKVARARLPMAQELSTVQRHGK